MSGKTDRQPLLPTHVNRSQSSRLSIPRTSFPSSSTSALGGDDDGASTLIGSTSSSAPKSGFASGSLGGSRQMEGKRPGLPKLSRECLISEIKCYGSYMLPPLLVFGVLVIGVSLFVYGWKTGWFS